jgi:hypothetical protein
MKKVLTAALFCGAYAVSSILTGLYSYNAIDGLKKEKVSAEETISAQASRIEQLVLENKQEREQIQKSQAELDRNYVLMRCNVARLDLDMYCTKKSVDKVGADVNNFEKIYFEEISNRSAISDRLGSWLDIYLQKGADILDNVNRTIEIHTSIEEARLEIEISSAADAAEKIRIEANKEKAEEKYAQSLYTINNIIEEYAESFYLINNTISTMSQRLEKLEKPAEVKPKIDAVVEKKETIEQKVAENNSASLSQPSSVPTERKPAVRRFPRGTPEFGFYLYELNPDLNYIEGSNERYYYAGGKMPDGVKVVGYVYKGSEIQKKHGQ